MDIMTGLSVNLDVALNHQDNAQKDFHQMVLKKQLVMVIALNA
jgi:hypothetical protein